MTAALDVEGLTTRFDTRAGTVTAVNNVSFSVAPGRILGLVGESGSGKSVTGFSILGLIDEPGRVTDGAVRVAGTDLRSLSPDDMRRMRGNKVSMVFQDPMMTLNPVLRIGDQMAMAVRVHRAMSKSAALEEARRALEIVGIPSPAERLKAYPHQLSGGMRQRVALARTLLEDRPVAFLDEPFSALDASTRAAMQDLAAQTLAGRTVLLVTHDPAEAIRLGHQVILLTRDGATRWPVPDSPTPRDVFAPDSVEAQAALMAALRGRDSAPRRQGAA